MSSSLEGGVHSPSPLEQNESKTARLIGFPPLTVCAAYVQLSCKDATLFIVYPAPLSLLHQRNLLLKIIFISAKFLEEELSICIALKLIGSTTALPCFFPSFYEYSQEESTKTPLTFKLSTLLVFSFILFFCNSDLNSF